MKKISKFTMALLIGAVSLGFTSCDSNDDPEGNGTVTIAKSEIKDVAQAYIDNVVYPTYTELAKDSRTLYAAAQALYQSASNGTMTQEQIDAACEAFKAARCQWERSEAFLYGSASNNDLDPHIDSWPLDHKELVSALNNPTLIAGFKSSDPAKFVSENNTDFQSVLGFHGMEFVLFRNGSNRTVEALSGNDTEEGMTSVKGIDELAFLQAVAGDVRNVTAVLEYTWLGDKASSETKSLISGEASYVTANLRYKGMANESGMCYGDFLLSPSATTGYGSWLGTINQIFVGGCSNICAEVADQKLGQAYRTATKTGSEEDSRDYIESPYSHRSFIDYQDNIYSIKNSLYGTRDITATDPAANSIMSLLQKAGYTGYSDLNSALNAALQALETAKNSGVSFVEEPGAQRVGDCIDAVSKLDDELNKAGTWINKQNEK